MASSSRPPIASAQGNDATELGVRHHRNLVRMWIVSCVAFLILAPLVSVMIGLHLHARNFQYIPNQIVAPPFNGRTVLMDVVLVNADPLAGVMTMDWTVIGEEKSPCNANNLTACTDINIFFDKCVLFVESRFPFNNLIILFR
jgi:hypothetical protein